MSSRAPRLRPATALLTVTAIACALAGGTNLARGALPDRHGGELTLPSAGLVRSLDPVHASTPFEATLTEAVFDGLYEISEDGRAVPVLANGPPEVEGTLATIRLRPGILHQGRRPLLARHVVRSLLRVSASAENGWLLGAFATEGGRPRIREVDDRTIEIELARRGERVDIVLAARPFAIVAGGDVRRRPLGTGAYHARLDSRGGVEMRLFRQAPDGAPWINQIHVRAPSDRDDEVRSFELGRIDASWWGQSLYGGAPARPARTSTARAATPVLLVPNRARVLRDDGAWAAVGAAIDRRRLERVGLVPQRGLGAGLPPPAMPSGSAPAGLSLRMSVRANHAGEARIAEALAGMLDERGIRLEVDRLSDQRYDAAMSRGQWDLRVAFVRPPLPGRGPLAGAALAAAGQADRARQLVPSLGDPAVAAQAARELGALVLGHERVNLHHRADLRGVRFDFTGAVSLAELSFERGEASP